MQEDKHEDTAGDTERADTQGNRRVYARRSYRGRLARRGKQKIKSTKNVCVCDGELAEEQTRWEQELAHEDKNFEITQ